MLADHAYLTVGRSRLGRVLFLVLLVQSAATIIAQEPKPAAQPAIDAALVPRLASAAEYVERFVSAFTNVVTEERYVQDLLTGGRLMARRPVGSTEDVHRELLSDLVLVRTGDALGWQMFRDVFEVDGSRVRDREARLARLFEQPGGDAIVQAARIARESARYNIGAVERTLNTPVIALLFLQATQQPRFLFSAAASTPGFSDRVGVVAFREAARPTIIRTVNDTDRPAAGRLWIERDTGTVLQTELVLSGDGVTVRFTTLFRHDDSLDVAVPVRMQEEYVLSSSKLVGTASYAGFRQFSVSTDTNVASPGASR
jgi:hypothetical protein